MSRGVDLDVTAIKPGREIAALVPMLDRVVERAGFETLPSIENIRLDVLAEWLEDGERCVAITQTRGGWQYLYDTDFSHANLANALSLALPGMLVAQFNLQEETDFTLRLLKAGEVQLAFASPAAEFLSIDSKRPPDWTQADAAVLASALECPDQATVFDKSLKMIRSGYKGERVGTGTRAHFKGGVQDAVQDLAAAAGMPHIYRFFEGWMKSDLDWDEDEVETVRAYRRSQK